MENKIVIYTAISGNYDKLVQPAINDNRVDFVCFTDDVKDDKIGVWNIRKIPYMNKDKTRIARYAKLNPDILLPEYTYSLWIDANVRIVHEYIYERIFTLINDGVQLSSIKHWGRNCLYEEAKMCIAANKDSIYKILRSIIFLKLNNYPRNNGLCETNVVFRKHTSSIVMQFNQLWWSLLNRYSKRDQLGFNYCSWNLSIDIEFFLDEGYTARNHFAFEYVKHPERKLSKYSKFKIYVMSIMVQVAKKLIK